MLSAFMGKCSHVQAYLPVASLNEVIESDIGDESVDLIEQVADPYSVEEAGSYRQEQIQDVRRFLATLPKRLYEIGYRTYWLDQSQGEIAINLNITRSAVSHALAKIHMLGRIHFGLPVA